MRDLFFWYIRTPIRNLWFDWTHRHETPMEREVRIANTKKRFREIYDSFRKDIPESKHVMEVAEWMDPLMDELLGRTK